MNSVLSFQPTRSENEASRRLYRGAGETSQRLEHSLNQVTNYANLFSPELTELRARLKDYCERLMFTDPLEYGKKAEDLLWRKVYYEFFQKCKQNKKKLLESDYFQHVLRSHLLAAVGSYHHMLLRIQTEFHIDLDGKVEVPFMWQLRGVKKGRWKKYQQSAATDDAVQTWANQACHRILTYLGDLARYIAELHSEPYPELENSHLAERYYLQAFCLNIKNGTPFNQLGSLANNRFDSAYYYMRCLSSVDKFEAAEGNLLRIFERNSQIVQAMDSSPSASKDMKNPSRFLTKFLKLCEIFYFASDENMQRYCQDALHDFDSCMPSDNELAIVADKDEGSSVGLKDEVVFKVTVMCMICVSRLHERESSDVSTAIAFTLALYSSIIHYTSMQLLCTVYETVTKEVPLKKDTEIKECNSVAEEHGPKEIVNSKNKTNELNQVLLGKKSGRKITMKKYTASRLRKLRRRRKISSTSQEDSELSDGIVQQKLHRRRKISSTSHEDSELSDVEILELAESDEENGAVNSDASQNVSCSSESLSEHEDDLLSVEQNNLENKSSSLKEKSNNVFIDVVEEFDKPSSEGDNCDKDDDSAKSVPECIKCEELLPAEKLVVVLSENKLLPSLKVLMDWLKINQELLTLCSENMKFFFSRLVELLNLLLKLESQVLMYKESFTHLRRSDKDWKQVFPLPEDILLQGLPALASLHSELSFDVPMRRKLSLNEQVFLRLQSLLSFGDMFSVDAKSLILFDKAGMQYSLKGCENKPDVKNSKVEIGSSDLVTNDIGNQRQQLMHEMAHLWLKAEVNSLERSIQSSWNPQLSPLLVSDASALCGHLPLLKQLVAAKSFVVIVPNIVIDNLDQVKKKSAGAREAIRWLEYVFHKGNRHIRAQRENERCSVNPIKYPKRKDKDAWDFFQILECCHFLVQQQSSGKTKSSFVTLLVGSHNQLPGNAAVVARSLNVSMENVESFFTKWHTSSKKPG